MPLDTAAAATRLSGHAARDEGECDSCQALQHARFWLDSQSAQCLVRLIDTTSWTMAHTRWELAHPQM